MEDTVLLMQEWGVGANVLSTHMVGCFVVGVPVGAAVSLDGEAVGGVVGSPVGP